MLRFFPSTSGLTSIFWKQIHKIAIFAANCLGRRIFPLTLSLRLEIAVAVTAAAAAAAAAAAEVSAVLVAVIATVAE